MNLPPRGQLYVAVVSAAGLLVAGHCVTALAITPIGWEWTVLAGLTLLSGSFTIRIPSLEARISVSETFVFTSVLLFGTCAGTITVALDTLVVALTRRRPEPLRILFNLSAATVSLWLAGHAFYLTSGIAPLSTAPTRVPELVGPLVAMTSIYFILNSGLVALVLATERQEPAFWIWRKNFLWLSVNYFGGASVAALLVSYTRTMDFAALSIIVPLLVISYLTYKTSLGRVEDAVQHVEEVNRMYLSTIETLATAIDAKDQVTHGHIRRVQRFALGLAQSLGVSDVRQLQAMEAAALLHDMGKIAVPEHILNKPSRLSIGEFEKMKLHSSVGADILSSIRFPYPVVPIVRHHHENWDGSGYPDGLRGTAIPLGARILAVVDCFDALTSDRPYRPKLGDAEAMRVLIERRGTMYDPLVVDKFVEHKESLEIGLKSPPEAGSAVEDIVKAPHLYGRSLEDLRSYGTATQALLGNLELRQALRTVTTLVRRDLAAELCSVYVCLPSSDVIVAVDAVGEHADELTGEVVALGARISGWVAANGAPIMNADARLELSDKPQVAAGAQCAAFPLRSGVVVLGVLLVVRSEGRPFSPDDGSYLEGVCLQFSRTPLLELVTASLKGDTTTRWSPARPRVH